MEGTIWEAGIHVYHLIFWGQAKRKYHLKIIYQLDENWKRICIFNSVNKFQQLLVLCIFIVDEEINRTFR